MTTKESAPVAVTQADRDAVQAFHRTMFDRLMSDIKSERPRLGEDEGDAGTLVQAFARHRLAALAQPRAAMVEGVTAGDQAELASIIACMDEMLADDGLDALAFDKHDSRIIRAALALQSPPAAKGEDEA